MARKTEGSNVQATKTMEDLLTDLVKEVKDLRTDWNTNTASQQTEAQKALIQAQNAANNPYAQYFDELRRKETAQTANPNDMIKKYGDDLGLFMWKRNEENKINNNQNMSIGERANAAMSLNNEYRHKLALQQEDEWSERGEKIGSIMSNTLDDIITDFDNFDDHMRKMVNQLANYIIKEGIDFLFKNMMGNNTKGDIAEFLVGQNGSGGRIGPAGNLLYSVGKLFGLFHSGGVVPSGASYSLPGTQEQLALLKGGERVLSPGENVQYEKQNQQRSPVIMNNLNIKAWDSKDVARCFKENKDLLNSITFQGIKDNNCSLRMMVRNA